LIAKQSEEPLKVEWIAPDLTGTTHFILSQLGNDATSPIQTVHECSKDPCEVHRED
jgi:hypothetical protein